MKKFWGLIAAVLVSVAAVIAEPSDVVLVEKDFYNNDWITGLWNLKTEIYVTGEKPELMEAEIEVLGSTPDSSVIMKGDKMRLESLVELLFAFSYSSVGMDQEILDDLISLGIFEIKGDLNYRLNSSKDRVCQWLFLAVASDSMEVKVELTKNK